MKLISLLIVFFFLSVPLHAKVIGIHFQDLVKKSDIIVEGNVVKQSDVSVKYDGFTLSKLSEFKISNIYKGEVNKDQIISIFTGSDFQCDVSNVQESKGYILFLKKYNDGYVDTHYGRGQYIVKEESGKKNVYPWSSDEHGEDYNVFVGKIYSLLMPSW